MPTTTKFIWDDGNYLAEADGSNTINVVYTNEPQRYGNLVSSRISGTTSYHHFDAIGSTRQLTNAAGGTTDTMIYDAWGGTVVRTGTAPVNLLWIGQLGYYFDVETARVVVRARSYWPQIARWSAVDPMSPLRGPAAYEYCFNAPLRFADPSGMVSVRIQADAFIPMDWLWLVFGIVQLKGDNRSVSKTPLPPSRSRVTSYIVVETEKCIRNDPKIAGGNAISPSTRWAAGVTQTALGTITGSETAARTGPCSVSVEITASATIPWVIVPSGAPAIDYTFSLTLTHDNAHCDRFLRVHATGHHDGFPAYELYARSTLIYDYVPTDTGGFHNILSLFGTGDVEVSADYTFQTALKCCCCIPWYCMAPPYDSCTN